MRANGRGPSYSFPVPRLPQRASRAARNVDWKRVYDTARVIVRYAGDAWRRLEDHERKELQQLLRKSRGKVATLSAAERRRMREIVMKAVGLNR
jgi:predicted metal-dependent hydrolase